MSICFWSWNYQMDEEEIRSQIHTFAQGGYGGFIIHARCGLRTPYMGTEWFRLYEAALRQAESEGLDVYIYDEDGWPSGFAGGAVPAEGDAYAFKALRYGYRRPDAGQMLAAFRKGTDGYRRIEIEEAKDGDLYFWYVLDRHYVDWLNPDTARVFLRTTYERYKRHVGKWFGTVIKGFFTDEPQLHVGGYPWSFALQDAYRAAYEADLLDELWKLTDRNEREFKRRFWTMVNEQMVRCFTKPLAAWCEENHLELTGHFAAEDGLCEQISANGGLLAHYAEMTLPGIDYLGNRQPSPVLLKQPASIANQLKDGRVLSESFGCSGWGASFARLAYNWAWQSVMGITRPCFHLAAYTMAGRRKRDYPAFFSYQEPWWERFSQLAGWMDSLNRLMTEGRRETSVLVVSPLYSAMGAYEDNTMEQAELRRLSAAYRQLLENLLDIQLDFEVTDESILQRFASQEKGVLRIGRCRYQTVYVAEGDFLSAGTAELLARFAAEGGRLCCVGPAPQALIERGAVYTAVMNRRALLEKEWLYAGDARTVRVFEADGRKTASDLALHIRALDGRRRIQVVNRRPGGPRTCVLHVKSGRGLVAHDLLRGDVRAIPSWEDGQGGLYAELRLYPGQNLVLDTAERAGSGRRPWLEETEVFPRVACTDRNCLTIDNAAFAVGTEDSRKAV